MDFVLISNGVLFGSPLDDLLGLLAGTCFLFMKVCGSMLNQSSLLSLSGMIALKNLMKRLAVSLDCVQNMVL